MAKRVVLDGEWRLRPIVEFSEVWWDEQAPIEGWFLQTLPGHWQQVTGLESHTGKVVYRKSFTADPEPGKVYHLRFSGVFYRYRVILNRSVLGEGEGYFAPTQFEVTSKLVRGANELVVEVQCRQEAEDAPYTQLMGAYGGGWSGICKRANPGGIWQPVEFITTGPAYLRDWNMETEIEEDNKAKLKFSTEIDSVISSTVMLKLKMTPHNFQGASYKWEWKLQIPKGTCRWETCLALEGPHLWWSWDLGDPDLYSVVLEIYGDDDHLWDDDCKRFGIRQFELRSFIPYLNGRRFLAKGSVYPPGSLYPSEMTPGRYLDDLRRAKAIHMNMLRVFSHLESDSFYNIADEEGLLLWQDFPLYGRYRFGVKDEAIRQTEEMVKLLRHHPSVVLWCLHNEPCCPSIRRTPLEKLALKVFSWNRDRLDQAMRKRVRSMDVYRPVVASSGRKTGLRFESDAHLLYGWSPEYGPKRRFENNLRWPRILQLKFATVFGAQSFPPYEESIQFLTEAGEQIDWKKIAVEQGLMVETMAHWFDLEELKDAKELVKSTQAYQVELLRYYIDRLRFHKYRPTGGILGSFLHDPYPCVQMSLLSNSRTPKPSYEALALAFRPVYVFTLLKKDAYYPGETVVAPIYLAHDGHNRGKTVEIKARLTSPRGDLVWKGQWKRVVEPDAQTMEIDRASVLMTMAGEYKLRLIWDDGEKVENTYYIHSNVIGRQQLLTS